RDEWRSDPRGEVQGVVRPRLDVDGPAAAAWRGAGDIRDPVLGVEDDVRAGDVVRDCPPRAAPPPAGRCPNPQHDQRVARPLRRLVIQRRLHGGEHAAAVVRHQRLDVQVVVGDLRAANDARPRPRRTRIAAPPAANTRPVSSDINDLMFKWSSGIFGPPTTTVLVHAVSASPSAWTAKFNLPPSLLTS